MKKLFWLVFVVLPIASIWAIPWNPFPGWNSLINGSSDIAVVIHPPTPPDKPTGKMKIIFDGVIDTDINSVYILKGDTKIGPSQLAASCEPRPGEYYLIFGRYHDGYYQAVEDYRVIPIGRAFDPKELAGKPLNDQIRLLLQHRLKNLNTELQKGLEEKKRLEEGLKK